MRYSFRLKDDRDGDLIEWMDSLGSGERSFYIRQALRAALSPQVIFPRSDSPATVIKRAGDRAVVSKEEAEERLKNLMGGF